MLGFSSLGASNMNMESSLGVPGTLVLILLLTVCMTASSVSGLDRSIKFLSNLNVILALGLLLFVFVAGPTISIVQITMSSLKEYILTLPRLAFRVVDGEGSTWMNQWTVMYYAWWCAWAPMVGIFYVRVSKGRTIRELVLAGLVAPVLVDVLWFGVFGGSSLILDLQHKAELAKVVTERGMEYPVFALLHQLPMPSVTVPLFLVLIAIFFVAGGDATAMSIAILSSGGDLDPANWMRVVWGGLQGLTAAMLILMGGMVTIEATSIVAGFFMVFLLCAALLATFVLLYRESTAKHAEPASVACRQRGTDLNSAEEASHSQRETKRRSAGAGLAAWRRPKDNSPPGRGKGRKAPGWDFECGTTPTPALRDRCRFAPPLRGRGFQESFFVGL